MPKKLSGALTIVPLAAMMLTIPACGKKATGQVAAVVNGDEITLQQVNAEIGAAKLPEGAQKEKVRNAVLLQLVDKQLLEQQAKAAGLDRDPDYLLRQRQANQALLIELYAKRASDTLKVPDPATVTKFIADHPYVFASREIFTVDQVRFAPDTDPAFLAGLKDLKTLDAIAAYLKDKGVQFVRGTNKIDSAQVQPDLLKQALAVPPGEPFIVPSPQGSVASVIVSRTPAPPPAAQAQPAAVQMIRQQALNDLLQQRLKDTKAKAKIEYQSGFAAPAPAPAAKGK